MGEYPSTNTAKFLTQYVRGMTLVNGDPERSRRVGWAEDEEEMRKDEGI